MRKLLLIAAALFSLGSMAQRPFESHTTFNSLNKSMKVNSLMSRMPAARIAKPANAQAKAPAKAPEGESHTYYLDCFIDSEICALLRSSFVLEPDYMDIVKSPYSSNR